MTIRPAFALLLALSIGACADGPATTSSSIPRSATLTEEIRIGGTEHDLVPFGYESGGSIAVARDGTIAISQAQDHRVRFFGADGTPLGDLGGDGSGPGEFERNDRIGWLGDSLWIYDPGLRRITLLTPARELARTMAVDREPTAAPALREAIPRTLFSYPLAMRADGGRTELVMPMRERSADVAGNHVYVATVTPQAELTKIVAMVPIGETSARDASGATASLPFANRTVLDVARDGSRSGFARAEIGSEGGTAGVHLFGRDGDTIFSRRMPIEVVPLPESVRDSAYSRWSERLPPSLGEVVRARAHEVTHYPPLEQMIIGRDGTVWLSLASQDGVRPHLVLTPEGDLMGEVSLSDRSRIAEAQRDRIWVIERDEFDVESLVRYGVEW